MRIVSAQLEFQVDILYPSPTSVVDLHVAIFVVACVQIPVFESKSVAASSVPVLEDEPEMDKAVVDQYIATIRAAASGEGDDS